jgi:GST-like protein
MARQFQFLNRAQFCFIWPVKLALFYGSTEREKIAVDQWLMWQMGGVGPMAGQAHHFLKYAPAMDPPHDLPLS